MDNHNERSSNGEDRKKKCPFMADWCIGDACALSVELVRNMGGLQQKFSICSFNALVQMISEVNAKTQPPQQKIQVPHLLRG